AGTSTEDDKRVHLQHITAEQDRHGVRENCDNKADEDQADPGFLQPRKETGPGRESHAGHEDRQTNGVEDTHRGLRHPAECRVNPFASTPRAKSVTASSAMLLPTRDLLVTTTSRNSTGKSSSTLWLTSSPISVPRAISSSERVRTATMSPSRTIVSG